ncbi:catalase family peroxidase [Alloacidobacterium sp.]|uniref:catalase family peroxidase n=1 Tax=Alloacidobacterium sp. TaxID=2951999 RepID=UPI002D6D63C0|nr:catalase family peroxidase [Alloacidobacterium sp.]HYK36429.1 catalase family peroxidase [Alloacidobacterium sp.]
MPLPTDEKALALGKDLLQAFDNVDGGYHPGFRAAHAKGVLLTGTFVPSQEAQALTKAPHIHNSSTPVSVRFSDFAGVPSVADNDPQGASPRGCAIRFHLAEHVHTDIVSHSANSFPTRTAEEFLEFLRAVAASGPSAPHPNPIEQFLGSHPAALAFVQMPKPFPTSFAREHFFAVSAFKFTSPDGSVSHGRYRVFPEFGTEYIEADDAAAKGPNYLFDELAGRLMAGPIKFEISVQLAGQDDVVDNATIQWPEDRPALKFGEITLNAFAPNNEAEQRQIIFDPIPRVDGIETAGDPLFDPRATIYLMSGRRRRAAQP